MMSFDQKLVALSTIRMLGLRAATTVWSRMHRTPPITTREELDELNRTHYAVDNGYLERTQANTVQYVDYRGTSQPTLLTKEYFANCTPNEQEQFTEGLAVLNCSVLFKSIKPHTVSKTKFVTKTAHNSSAS